MPIKKNKPTLNNPVLPILPKIKSVNTGKGKVINSAWLKTTKPPQPKNDARNAIISDIPIINKITPISITIIFRKIFRILTKTFSMSSKIFLCPTLFFFIRLLCLICKVVYFSFKIIKFFTY